MAARIWKTWATAAVLALAAAVSLPAAAQEPPGRAARLTQPTGGVQWSGPDGEWRAGDPNWPFTAGDSIRVAAGSRAELHAGAHALRLQGPAELSIDALDADDLRLTLRQGSLNLRARDMAPDERIEINTQNLAMLVDRPGEFRVDAEPDSTRVLARAGTATLYGENGESATLAPAQQARYVGRDLRAVAVQGAAGRDALDQWAADRSLAEDRSPSAQYLSREVLGYQELDANGEWATTADYGTVWYPRTTIVDWAPYRHGQWRWVDPWGWTWFDDARWGFAPFHYGRWVQIGPRWAWAPGPRGPRPYYAPALVGFAGTPGPRPPGFGQHRTPGTDWFPLAPGQPWRPGLGTSPRDPGRGNPGLPLRSTQRERPPGPIMATPAPGFEPGRAGDDRRERWQREQEWQQQQRRQQMQDQGRSQFQLRQQQQRQEQQMQQEQQQRMDQARQQQQALQEQQMRQMQQLRQQQDAQQRQMQEPQRQQGNFLRDHMERREQREMREQRQDRPPPPRAAPPQEPRQAPGERERGGRFGNRD